MLEVRNIVGIHTTDPKLPGTLYLTDDGDLTKDPKKAKKVEDSRLHRALKEIKLFSTNYFIRPIAD
jgi:hypothetical protein